MAPGFGQRKSVASALIRGPSGCTIACGLSRIRRISADQDARWAELNKFTRRLITMRIPRLVEDFYERMSGLLRFVHDVLRLRPIPLILSLTFLLFAHSSPVESAGFPNAGWKTASPESQGLDSAVLAEALDYVRLQKIPAHSFLIMRNGRIVLDAYFYPYLGREVHDVASVTKSVTSILVGIAIEKGYLKGVDQKVASTLSSA